MLNIPSIMLAGLLAPATVSVLAVGCYPAYSPDSTYSAGDWVSATTTTSLTMPESCTVGSAGCSASGFKIVTSEKMETHNYQCVQGPNSAFCGQSSYTPGGQYSGTAWTEGGLCLVSVIFSYIVACMY